LSNVAAYGGNIMTAQLRIYPSKFCDILRTKDLMKHLPEEARFCSEHGEEVIISESELLPNQNGGVPFARAAFVGCCDSAIRKLNSAIIAESLKRGVPVN